MERHFKRRHADEAADIAAKKQKVGSAGSRGKHLRKQTQVLNGVPLSMDKIMHCCVKIVTVSGRSFTHVNDEGLRDLLDAVLSCVPQEERKAVTPETVRENVRSEAAKIRQELAEEIKGKLICLKVDGVSRLGRSFLGINIQFISNGKLQIRTLGVVELVGRHTAEYLKVVILSVLSGYDISERNLYSFTCDNGANMVLAASLLDEKSSNEATSSTVVIEPVTSDHDDLISDDEEDSTDHSDLHDLSNNEFNLYSDQVQPNESDDITAVLESCEVHSEGDLHITCVRCAVHTLQLAINDALQRSTIARTISRMRDLAVKLRTSSVSGLLKARNLNKPKLDVETRWHSTVDMLLSLIPLKDFCKDFPKAHKKGLSLPAVVWSNSEKIISALLPAKIATKKLQAEDLLMGDFYGAWLTCKARTQMVGNPLSKFIVQEMEKREQTLKNNEAFVSALYMDPRYYQSLSADECQRAETHLVRVWRRLEELEAENKMGRESQDLEEESMTVEDTPTAAATSADAADDNILLESILASADNERGSIQKKASFNILPVLQLFKKGLREPVELNVLQFWKSREFTSPNLYKLACVVLAVPATQVSCERVFSGLKFILDDRRFNLKDHVVDDIMVVRYYTVFNLRKQKKKQPQNASKAADDVTPETSLGSSASSTPLKPLEVEQRPEGQAQPPETTGMQRDPGQQSQSLSSSPHTPEETRKDGEENRSPASSTDVNKSNTSTPKPGSKAVVNGDRFTRSKRLGVYTKHNEVIPRSPLASHNGQRRM